MYPQFLRNNPLFDKASLALAKQKLKLGLKNSRFIKNYKIATKYINLETYFSFVATVATTLVLPPIAAVAAHPTAVVVADASADRYIS